MLTKSSVIFPAAVASAFSSHVVRSSNHCSTAAALPEFTPRSISVAPNENNPLGICKNPEPIPASIDSKVPTLLLGPEEPAKISSIVAMSYLLIILVLLCQCCL